MKEQHKRSEVRNAQVRIPEHVPPGSTFHSPVMAEMGEQ
jgi:hypothetical protein